MAKKEFKSQGAKPEQQEVFDTTNALTKAEFQETQKATFEMEQASERPGLQQMRTQYTTAVRVIERRNIYHVLQQVQNEVEFDPEAMFYSWIRG